MSKKLNRKTKRQQRKEQELTIIGDIKEPFTLEGFVEKHIIERWRKFKMILDENGILFFFLSPFQYRNRLVSVFTLIVICTLGGIIPRTLSLIEATKERNASSELAIIENKRFTNDIISVLPLASSHVDRKHVMTFLILGETTDGVPSTPDGFNIYLSALRGVTDPENVEFRYSIIPMDSYTRLLVLATDNTNQTDKTGIYNLNISVIGRKPMRRPIEIILSDTQEQNPLFDGLMIDLSTLAPILSKQNRISKSGPIQRADTRLADVIQAYKLTEDRLKAIGIKTKPSSKEVVEWVDKHQFLKGVSDESTTSIVASPVSNLPEVHVPDIVLTHKDGTSTSRKSFEGDKSYEQSILPTYKEYPTVQKNLNSVHSALSALNSARLTKYQQLYAWSTAFNTPMTLSELGKKQIVLKSSSEIPQPTEEDKKNAEQLIEELLQQPSQSEAEETPKIKWSIDPSGQD